MSPPFLHSGGGSQVKDGYSHRRSRSRRGDSPKKSRVVYISRNDQEDRRHQSPAEPKEKLPLRRSSDPRHPNSRRSTAHDTGLNERQNKRRRETVAEPVYHESWPVESSSRSSRRRRVEKEASNPHSTTGSASRDRRNNDGHARRHSNRAAINSVNDAAPQNEPKPPVLRNGTATVEPTPELQPSLPQPQQDVHAKSSSDVPTFIPDPPSVAEGPPPPLHPPLSLASLRVLLLVGFISSKALMDPNVARLVFSCPIHSMAMARVLKDYFKRARKVSSRVLLAFRSCVLATELRQLALGVVDPLAGELGPLLAIESLPDGEVIVETFDFMRCDYLVRFALRRDHPSTARVMWDATLLPSHRLQLRELPRGSGAGVDEPDSTALVGTTAVSGSVPSVTPPTPLTGFSGQVPLLASANFPHISTDPGLATDLSQKLTRVPLSQQGPIGVPPLPFAPFHHPPAPLKAPTRPPPVVEEDTTSNLNLEELLSAPSAKEQQAIESGAELRDLLAAPTAKHSITTRTFQNRGGSRVQQICRHGTRHECLQAAIAEYTQRRMRLAPGEPFPPPAKVCSMIHFRRILLPHTDLSLGDCSYLDTCRHMATCRFVHYEVDLATGTDEQRSELLERMEDAGSSSAHTIGTVMSTQIEERPAQWITCDVRKFDWTIFRGKVKIVMADPPWDIHMDLPYGTMTDAEMKALRLDLVQDEGLLFLWVTGRAMELGRECMKLWGYKQVEEIVWVKTNQLHRIIRTGRTGHWLNHSKEHCLVGIKGQPKLNRYVDTDIIVAEVRETSRKPDEIYRIIERLSPGPYKLELFGRQHNVRNNWITLGNQLDNIRLHDEQLIQRYNAFVEDAGLPAYVPSESSLDDERKL